MQHSKTVYLCDLSGLDKLNNNKKLISVDNNNKNNDYRLMIIITVYNMLQYFMDLQLDLLNDN